MRSSTTGGCVAFNPNAPMFELVSYGLSSKLRRGKSAKRVVQRKSGGLQHDFLAALPFLPYLVVR
jgi:hypothetical protein